MSFFPNHGLNSAPIAYWLLVARRKVLTGIAGLAALSVFFPPSIVIDIDLEFVVT